MGFKRVFTEQVDNINHRTRITERMQRVILYTFDNFATMKAAKAQLELKWRQKKNDVWPTTIGIDEHSFIRNMGNTSYCIFAKSYFPNAKIIADKFHVVRLPMHSLQKYLKQLNTDSKKHKLR